MSNRVLVTGATGFVGQALVAKLRAQGWRLTVAVRNMPAERLPETRTVPVGNIGRSTDWSTALENVDAVVHLAAHVHVAPERAGREAELFDEVNHLGSLRLFDAASAAGVGLFVFVSSITVLGSATEPGRPFSDASPPRPTTPYARSKLDAEMALASAAASRGPRLVILRPPLVVGPGVGGNVERLLRLASLPIPLPLGGLSNRRTILGLDTLVSATISVLDKGRNAPAGTYVLGERAALSTSEILRELRAGLGRRPGLIPAPAKLMRGALAAVGRAGLAERLFGSLEIDASGFDQTFAPSAGQGSDAALREAARVWLSTR